ncbi:MAG TPA: LPS export ABC transporter permease LptF [Steroidobacteraceae bacterium]|nr:LPS export ABC transporter permease LptF [Steroidobacteraceae bacterium]
MGGLLLRILDRYILREVAMSWLSVSGVLLAIMLTDQVARVLERAAERQYPRGVVFELIMLGAVQSLPLVLPIALLLGIVLALGRLYHDSEMTAAQACGTGSRIVVLPVMLFTAALTVLLAYISLQVAPAAAGRMLNISSEALRAGQFAPINAGKFSTFGGGSTVVYAQSADSDGTLRRVFVQRSRDNVLEIALAQSATHSYSEGGDLQIITLFDGQRYEGIPGERHFRIVRFAENTIPVRLPAMSGGALKLEGIPTRTLLASSEREQLAELHWRLALPIMAVVMGLIAVPLARLRPRQGRYARVGFAILIFFLYINLAIAGKSWIERGVLPVWLGLWWVHATVALFAATLLVVPKVLARLRYRRNVTRGIPPVAAT